MSHGPEVHHPEDPFEKHVAMTMAIVAAALAFVTMLSHNAHNQTLLLQGDANRLQTEANIHHTKASDHWSYFQAKNIRYYQTQAYLNLYEALDRPAPPPAAAKKGAPPPAPAQPPAVLAEWRAQVDKYKEELPKLEAEARAVEKEAEHAKVESEKKLEESHHAHKKGARFDLAELAIELALILCSVSVLSKRNALWYAGIAATVAGIAITGTAFL
jgi:hypothetical protein